MSDSRVIHLIIADTAHLGMIMKRREAFLSVMHLFETRKNKRGKWRKKKMENIYGKIFLFF